MTLFSVDLIFVCFYVTRAPTAGAFHIVWLFTQQFLAIYHPHKEWAGFSHLHRSVFLALRWGSGPSHVSWSIPVEWEMITFWESLEPVRAILHVWPPDTAERAMFNWLLIDKCLIMLFKANWCLYLCHQTSSTPTIPITLTFWMLLISDQLKWGFVGKCSPTGSTYITEEALISKPND